MVGLGLRKSFLAALLCALPAFASTTLTIATPGNVTPPVGAYVRADIVNCLNPTVVNSSTQLPQSQRYYFNGATSITVTMADNVTQIACSGNQLSYYTFTYVANGVQTIINNGIGVELNAGTFALANLNGLTAPPFNPGVIQGPPGTGVIALTTNGNRGAATLAGQVLNVPQYSVGISGNYLTSFNSASYPGYFAGVREFLPCNATTPALSVGASGADDGGSIRDPSEPFLLNGKLWVTYSAAKQNTSPYVKVGLGLASTTDLTGCTGWTKVNGGADIYADSGATFSPWVYVGTDGTVSVAVSHTSSPSQWYSGPSSLYIITITAGADITNSANWVMGVTPIAVRDQAWEGSQGLYAPSLIKNPSNGKFQVFYSSSNGGACFYVGLAEATTITGPYTKLANNSSFSCGTPAFATNTNPVFGDGDSEEPSVAVLDNGGLQAFTDEPLGNIGIGFKAFGTPDATGHSGWKQLPAVLLNNPPSYVAGGHLGAMGQLETSTGNFLMATNGATNAGPEAVRNIWFARYNLSDRGSVQSNTTGNCVGSPCIGWGSTLTVSNGTGASASLAIGESNVREANIYWDQTNSAVIESSAYNSFPWINFGPFQHFDTGTGALGGTCFGDGLTPYANNVCAWRGTANGSGGSSNWLNLDGYDGIAFNIGNYPANVNQKTKVLSCVLTGCRFDISNTSTSNLVGLSLFNSSTGLIGLQFCNASITGCGTNGSAQMWQIDTTAAGDAYFAQLGIAGGLEIHKTTGVVDALSGFAANGVNGISSTAGGCTFTLGILTANTGACGAGGGGGNVTTTGTPASGNMAKFSGATSITNAVSGTDYAPGTNPTGGQNNYAPIATPTFSGTVTGTSYVIPQSGTATSSANFNPSGSVALNASYWNGSTASSDVWAVSSTLGTGANPPSTLNLTHSGTTGLASVAMPATTITASTAAAGLNIVNTYAGANVGDFSLLCPNTLSYCLMAFGTAIGSGTSVLFGWVPFTSSSGMGSLQTYGSSSPIEVAATYLGTSSQMAVGNGGSFNTPGFSCASGVLLCVGPTSNTAAPFTVDSNGTTIATIFQEPLHTPTSSSETCTTGAIRWDAGFIYICTATNTFKRVALSTF